MSTSSDPSQLYHNLELSKLFLKSLSRKPNEAKPFEI